MPRKNSTRKNNSKSIQDIDKLIEEVKKNDLPSCFIKCGTPNCDCFTINVISFLKFIGKEQKEVFGIILTDSKVSDDFTSVSYDNHKLCEYVNDFYEDEFSSIISSIKSADIKTRNMFLEFRKDRLENHDFPKELDNDNNSKLISNLNYVYREFKTLTITNKVARFYVSILEYNDKLDEHSKEMMEQEYIALTNSNSIIINILKECCQTLLRYYICKYIIETLNKH